MNEYTIKRDILTAYTDQTSGIKIWYHQQESKMWWGRDKSTDEATDIECNIQGLEIICKDNKVVINIKVDT